MDTLLERLNSRALAALNNKSEVKQEALLIAIKECKEICRDKNVPMYAMVDIAYIRLKIYLKVELNGEDELLFKEALKVVQKSPKIQGVTLNSSKYYKSQNKKEFL